MTSRLDGGHFPSIASVAVDGWNGSVIAGGHRLTVHLQIELRATVPTVDIRDFRGELHLIGPNVEPSSLIARGDDGLCGHAVATASGSEALVQVHFDVTPAALEYVERWRNGSAPSFRVFIKAWAQGARRRRWWKGGDQVVSSMLSGAIEENVPHDIWCKVLASAGYGASMLVELPLASSPEMTPEVVRELRAVEVAMLQARYADAVGGCRKVLDLIAPTKAGDEHVLGSSEGRPARDEELSVDQRIWKFVSGVRTLTQPGMHVNIGGTVQRREAQLVVSGTHAIAAVIAAREAAAEAAV